MDEQVQVNSVEEGSAPTSSRFRWLTVSRGLLAAAIALVPLAAGYIPFMGRAGIFMGNTSIPAQSSALGILVGASLSCWAVALYRGETAIKRIPYMRVLVAFIVLVIVSSITAIDRVVAVFGAEYAEQGLLTFFGYIAVFFLTVQLIRRRNQFSRILQVLAVSGGVVALYGVLQSLGLPFYPLPQDSYLIERGTSTLGNPDMLGTFLIVPLMISLGLSVSTRTGWRWFWRAVVLLTTASLLLTQTRGAWLGALIALLAFGAIMYRSRKTDPEISGTVKSAAILLIPVGIGVALYRTLVGGQPLFARIAQMFSGANVDGGRLLVWSETLKIIRTHPVLGAGPDNFLYAWYQVATSAQVRIMGIDGVINDAHSYWLGTAASSGILSALLLIIFIGCVLWGSRSAVSKSRAFAGSAERVTFEALWAGVLGLCVALTFSVVLTPIGLLLWFSLGLLVIPLARGGREVSGRSVAKWAACAVSVILGILLVIWGVLNGLSSTTEYVANGSGAVRLQAARSAATLAPWRPYPLFLEAQLLEAQGAQADQILPLVDKMIVLVPHGYEYYKIKARLLADQPQRVIDIANQGLAVYPAGLRLIMQRAVAQATLGDFEPAKRDAAAAWEIARKVIPAYREPNTGIAYAQILGAAGDYADAKTVLRELQVSFPNNRDIAVLQSAIDSAEAQ